MKPAYSSEYPFRGRRLGLGGYAMHYLEEGKGETVLMVHGNPTWSFYFRNLVKALSPERRCVVPDHIGMGLSDRPKDGDYAYTLKSRVDDLETLMELVAPSGPVTLILHDWGGMIGMSWAARHPERIKAIPAGLRIMRGPLGTALRLSRFVRRTVLKTCTVKARLRPEVESAYLDVCDGWDESIAIQRFVQDIPLGPGDPAWDAIMATEAKLDAFKDTPMLLPWGMKDWVFDEAFLNGWKKRFPKAHARRFEDCGHFLLEDANEEVTAMIRDFVLGKVPA
jgi:cis-3-alkyl-4-acyloxetan-2-one decarboxylase